jgi:monoamine oxidase
MAESFSKLGFLAAIGFVVAAVFYMRSNNSRKHVVIVGGGLAGLSASIEAARQGARVTLLEQEKMLGGNSAKASSGEECFVFLVGLSSEPFGRDHELKEDHVKQCALPFGDALGNFPPFFFFCSSL